MSIRQSQDYIGMLGYIDIGIGDYIYIYSLLCLPNLLCLYLYSLA